MLKKGDFLIAIILLLLIAGSFFGMKLYRHLGADAGRIALIIQDGKVLSTINLEAVSTPESFNVDGKFKHVILMEHGRIRFSEADCPDEVCVKIGWMKEPGEIAACVPDRIIIKVVGRNGNVDTVSY